MHDIMTVAIDAAREAGEFLRSQRRTVLAVETKEDRSLVTNADKEAERLIVARIEAAFPGHDILGEERGRTSRGSDHTWVIDPLDGTHNYIRGLEIYGVSIGVLRGSAFAAGAIYIPETREMYGAERGGGAFRNDRKIHVSGRADLASATLAFDSELRLETRRKVAVLGNLCPRIFNIRLVGSSARILSYISEGVVDGVIEFSDKPWDFAAGVVLVEEAGGTMTSFSGAPLSVSDSAYIASNALLHAALRDATA